MKIDLPAPITTYLDSVNHGRPTDFLSTFAPDAVVHDIGRDIRGHAAILKWATEEIYAVNVTLEPLSGTRLDDQFILQVKVDGTFDRTGLPDPLIMDHVFAIGNDKISRLTCRLA